MKFSVYGEEHGEVRHLGKFECGKTEEIEEIVGNRFSPKKKRDEVLFVVKLERENLGRLVHGMIEG